MYGIEQNRAEGGVLRHGSANMRHVLNSEVLDALKESLRDLESLKMVSAIEPEVKQHLHTTIAKLESEDFADYEYELAA
jgi:hypothetical protein